MNSTPSRPFGRRLFAGTALLIGLAIPLAGCAGQAPEQADPAPTGSTDRIAVGIFVANAFGDHSFYDAAGAAIPTIESDYDAVVSTYEGKSDSQAFAPLLQDAADANQLVFVLGNQAIDATVQAAAQNPDTTFVFVNGIVPSDDVVSVTFRNEEGCYMAGAVAGIVNQKAGKDTIGFMGGFEAPSVKDCEAGYVQGATDIDPSLKVVSQLVGSFSDPAKGLEVANAEAQQGAYSILSFAGLSGQGLIGAAEAGADIVPIMADSAPSDVAAAILSNHTEVLLLDTVEKFTTGALTKGDKAFYGFKESAYEMSYNDALLTADEQKQLEQIEQDVIAGTITPAGA